MRKCERQNPPEPRGETADRPKQIHNRVVVPYIELIMQRTAEGHSHEIGHKKRVQYRYVVMGVWGESGLELVVYLRNQS